MLGGFLRASGRVNRRVCVRILLHPSICVLILSICLPMLGGFLRASVRLDRRVCVRIKLIASVYVSSYSTYVSSYSIYMSSYYFATGRRIPAG